MLTKAESPRDVTPDGYSKCLLKLTGNYLAKETASLGLVEGRAFLNCMKPNAQIRNDGKHVILKPMLGWRIGVCVGVEPTCRVTLLEALFVKKNLV